MQKNQLFAITLVKKPLLRYNNRTCRCGEMADTLDSGSSGKPCGFKSRHLHQTKHRRVFFCVLMFCDSKC